MTFRIDKALLAVCAISFLCALGASAKAETNASGSNDQALSKSHSHRVSSKHPHKYTTVSQYGSQYRGPARPQYYAWGARLVRTRGTRIRGILLTQWIIRAITVRVG